jgi:hypothetical protein
MSPRRATIPQRRRIFFGCEGESEQGYGALLSRLVEESGLHLAIHSVLLRPGGGDPLDLITLAVELNERDERRRGRYSVKAVLLDRDKLGVSPDRDRRMGQLATDHNLHLIWQDPSHEALLLRHLPGCQNLRPPTTPAALQELRRRWEDYRKPMTAVRLASRIRMPEVVQASLVEPALREFLQRCRILAPD